MVLEAPTEALAASGHASWARLIRTLTEAGDSHSLFTCICRDVVEEFGFSRALFASVERRHAVLAARGGYDPAVSPHVAAALLMLYRVPLNPDPDGRYLVAAWCVNQREQVWIHDASHYDFRPDQTKQLTLLIKAFGVQEYVLTPIVWAGRSIGLLGVDKKGQNAEFSAAELEVLRSICDLIGWRLGPLLTDAASVEVARAARRLGPRAAVESDGVAPGASEAGFVDALLDGLDEGLLLLNAKGRIRYGNRAVLSLLEVFPWEISGKNLLEVFPLPGLEELLAGIQGTGTQPLFPLRGRLQRPSKEQVEVELRLLGLGSGPERSWGVVIRPLEQEEALDQLRTYSLAMLVHDLKAPVQSVIGFAELLRLGRLGTVNSEQSNFLRRIEESGEGILQLVERALEVGEFESLALLRRQPIEVGAMIEGVVRQLAGKAELAGVRLHTEVPAAFPTLWGDRDRMIQVFQNLVDNAIDASSQGGNIRVVGTAVVRDEIPAAEFLVVTERVRLKEDADPGKRPIAHRRATGLGLMIARLVIQAHGGEATLEDLAEGGVAVRFLVPLGTDPDNVTSA